MQITIEVRNVYGNKTIYPVCETAKLLAQLAGTKTFTHHALITIEALGYEIVSTADLDFRQARAASPGYCVNTLRR